MKKRLLAVMIAGVMALGTALPVLADEGTEPKDPFGYDYVSQDVDADLTVYRYYADSDKDNLDYAIQKMTEKYPNLSFTMEHRTDSDGVALRTWAAVGELPDIFEINASDVYQTLKEEGSLYVVDEANIEQDFMICSATEQRRRKRESPMTDISTALAVR